MAFCDRHSFELLHSFGTPHNPHNRRYSNPFALAHNQLCQSKIHRNKFYLFPHQSRDAHPFCRVGLEL